MLYYFQIMKKKLFLNLFIIFFSTNVFAALDITISQGKVEPTPIAITNFYEESEIISKNGEILRNIISKNLTNSGLFYTVDDSLYIQKGNLVEKVPRFEDWKIINAQFLLSADIKKVDNTYSVRLRLYDVLAAQEIKAVKMSIPNINLLRRLVKVI